MPQDKCERVRCFPAKIELLLFSFIFSNFYNRIYEGHLHDFMIISQFLNYSRESTHQNHAHQTKVNDTSI